jgi:aminomethyltransferase
MVHKTIQFKRTCLHELEEQAGAKFTRFAGWEMAADFGSAIVEARAVREEGKAALFNTSHMGEFLVSGPGATEFLDYMLTNNVAPALAGRNTYSPMCHPNGGTVDDLMVYKKGPDDYMLIVNAGNAKKDWD